jgi:hypothetical protein
MTICHADGIVEDRTLSANTRLHDSHVNVVAVLASNSQILGVRLELLVTIVTCPLTDYSIIPLHPVIELINFLAVIIVAR